MNPMPTVAKAYSMIRQEEKQREGFISKISVNAALSAHSNNYRNSYNNGGRNGRNYSGNYSQGESSNGRNYSGNYGQGEPSVRNTTSNGNNPRRSVFKKGVICGNRNKEGHTKEECYQLVGYPIGHPLHGKYRPPNTPQRFHTQDNSSYRAVNMTMGQNVSLEVTNVPSQQMGQNDVAMCARIDQLQNQLNQMMLMMQNNKDSPGISTEGKPKLIATFITRTYKLIASHITAKKYIIIASVLINQKYLWVVDSGATDHVCYSLTLMHNVQICTQPILVTLPNGQQTHVTKTGPVHINSAITLHDVLYIPSFSYNLLSVSKLGSHIPLSILFTPFSCYFQDHHKRIAHGNLYNGLYIIKQEQT
ncbi:hypothetical protein Tco_1140219 [Tanacetum coccineum]